MMEAVKAASIFRQYGKERAGDDMYGSGENGDAGPSGTHQTNRKNAGEISGLRG